MAEHSGKTITFGADLLPLDDDTYFLGNENKKWKIYGDVTGTISGYLPYKGNVTALGSGSPHGTVKTWWESTTNVPKLSVLAAYNNSGAEKTLIFSKGNADKTYGTVLAWGYTDKYIRILRKNNASSWLSSDWEKIDAGYADSAGTATTATNLASNPSIQTSGTTQVTITAGGKTSDAFTIPYATSAGSIAWANVSGKPIDFNAYSGALNTNGWKTMGARTSGAKIYIAYNNNPASWNSLTYSSSLVFGCNDTKGLLDIACNSPIVTFGGSTNGNSTDDAPKWYFKLSATSGQTYTFPATSKTLAASDGSNASGTNWAISITGKAGSVDWANTGHPDTFPPSTHNHDGVYAPVSHGTHVTTDSVKSALSISSNGSATKWLNEQGSWTTPTAADVGALSDDTVVTNVAFTSATDNNEYPILIKNSTGSTTTAASAKFPNASGKPVTVNPSTGTITATTFSGNATTASKISATLNQTTKTYLLGTTTTITATAANVSLTGDTGIYLTTTAGELSAYRYSWHYGANEKAYTLWNDTDQSIDFVFI